MELAEIGDVLSATTSEMPWKLLIHTVCTDGSYISSPDVIRSVIIKSLRVCIKEAGIEVVSISELGTGFGTLSSEQFNCILTEVAMLEEFSCIKKIIVCKFGTGKQ